MNYTKGEWEVGGKTEHDFHAGLIMLNGGYDENEGGFPNVCYINDMNRQAETDAHLIAAAPDLYEALKEARLQIEYLHGKFQETSSGNNVLAKIDNALAKAEGK
jgi:hypothetical protein